ncbi:BTAD domain-containing putative transcriptional regulator [Streptomyces sioyaensis]|uniref:AfsR/SARP family transcriptional regulator n=1 Tax=Streptomyces sioyaensis TaxID=67364 RepID=UPI0037956B06
MRFSVLGSLEVTMGTEQVKVGGLRQQCILATLLLNVGRVVSIGRLAEAVWDTTPPATAKEQVQNCVSMLRGTLTAAGAPRDIVVTRPPGYLLQVAAEELDMIRFTESLAAGRAETARGLASEAVEKFRAGLELWRGPAFDALPSRVVRAGADRLNEQRIVALEECIGLELQLGHHRELVGELSSLIAEYPLREGLRGQLMLALYRSGRQAEALEVYRRTRRTLIEELGLEPGHSLQQLEQSILAADRTLDPWRQTPATHGSVPENRAIPRQLPLHLGALVGVDRHEETVRRALARRESGPALCVVTGEGGVGKTSLAVHSAHRVAAEFPDGQLYADLRGSRPDPASVRDVLGRFLNGLGISAPDSLVDRVGAYRSRLADRRVLLVLDDIKDEETLRMLMPSGSGCAAIATSRARLSGPGLGQVVALEPLDTDTAVALLAATVGDGRVEREPEAAARVVALCGQLPLTVRGAGVRLAAKPHWSVARLVNLLGQDDRRFDELERGGCRVRVLFDEVYRQLRPAVRLVFRRAGGLPGAAVSVAESAALAGLTAAEAEQALEDAVDLRLMAAHETETGHVVYRFTELSRTFARECAAREDHEPHTPGIPVRVRDTSAPAASPPPTTAIPARVRDLAAPTVVSAARAASAPAHPAQR